MSNWPIDFRVVLTYNSSEVSKMKTSEEAVIYDELYSRTIGKAVMQWVRGHDPESFTKGADSEAVSLIRRIKAILDDDTLRDADCFLRIDAIVSEFCAVGIPTGRHLDTDG